MSGGNLFERLAGRLAELIAAEQATGFDPAANAADLDTLRGLLERR